MKKKIWLAGSLALAGVFGTALAASRSGERMPDGTVYSGISPDTHKPFYTTRSDAPGTYQLASSKAYCAALEEGGYKDWRAPSKEELNVEFQNRAAIGGFKETGSLDAMHYWTSEPLNRTFEGWTQSFQDGHQDQDYWNAWSSLRCVRD